MSQPLVIYGAGGLGREVKSMLPYTGQAFELIGFLDDGLSEGTSIDQIPILGGLKWLEYNSKPIELLIAIGNPKVKSRIVRATERFKHIHFPVLIHERAHIQERDSVRIGQGSIICAGVVLTTAITIGDHVLINLNATIGHDTVIGSCASIMPGVNVAGHVKLGSEVMVGSGANIINQVKVGDFSIVAAGSVVNHDVPPASTAAGVPARIIR